MLHLNGLGIFLGLVFTVGIGTLCYWAFRSEPNTTQAVRSARRPANNVSRVLVPVMPATLAESAVERACRWEPPRPRELVLVYVIVVPDILTLDHPLPEQDRAANRALERAYAIAKERGLSARMYIVRQRNVADGILQVAREEQVDAIMLTIGAPANTGNSWEQTSGEILHRASCEVVVDRGGLTPPMGAPA